MSQAEHVHVRMPQTLQNLCFFKIAEKVESYSPDALLAHLPPTQRSMLLLRLSVMDAIKLEGTCAVRGINMNTVWEQLYNQWHHTLDLVDYPFEKSAFLLEGGWKEYYLSVCSSIILNPLTHPYSVCNSSERCFHTMLFTYYWYLLTPDHYEGLDDTLDTPMACASYLMKECNYKPKVVYISCSLFFQSPIWKERDSEEVSSTFREFLSEIQEIVFTSDEEEINKWYDGDDEYEFLQLTIRSNQLCEYVLDMILSSNDPKLESVRINDLCPEWIADSITYTFDAFFGAKESVGDENTTCSYKQLKKINISVEESGIIDDDGFPQRIKLIPTIETQDRLEVVQLSQWPYSNHITFSNLRPGMKRLFSALVSLFKQPQFQCLELKAISILYPTLPEILGTFFTALSPTHQSLTLESLAIIQKKSSETPDSFILPIKPNETLLEKSLHLSNMELTPSQETLIFSYPLLSLESLALVKLTSTSLSKSLERAADLLEVNKISHLKMLILKDIIKKYFLNILTHKV